MSAEVKILLEGYTNADAKSQTGEERTRPTITLVRDGSLVIVVDPGIVVDQQMLIDALMIENLTPDDVNLVCITHSHIDHYKNAGMFPKAKILEHYGLWERDTVTEWSESFSPHIQILRTPGHDATGITLLITTDEGKIAICGDVFWRENSPKDPADDMYASDPKKLAESRKLVLKMADWIIPGHGPIFPAKVEDVKKEEKTIDVIKKKSSNGTSVCKKCHTKINKEKDRCLCRPWLCFRDCECGLDCEVCNCSHKLKRK